MKRAFSTAVKITGIVIVLIAAGTMFIPAVFGFILFRTNHYNAFNETHKPINVYLFQKNQTSNNDKTDELIVYFPSEISYRYLTIVPSHELIGLADQTEKSIWIFPGAKIAYMFPNGSYFTPLGESYFNFISESGFSKDIIWFNTFGDLKKLGERIVIQRNMN
ncbi:hypothetical protein [Dyadobacter psychrotolerans]|uniref:Uncharacterized protein n=1 Tax=Dyadobacter psychrotolerans TaxID=2541721 RepID=A0A4R5DB50_9BACT|nr:hypothetical protein [Dyadobacter psychrotolerans]TDE09031.1 hypothetical protein E0F88_31610 [Dyadobacter psychrotolerans]